MLSMILLKVLPVPSSKSLVTMSNSISPTVDPWRKLLATGQQFTFCWWPLFHPGFTYLSVHPCSSYLWIYGHLILVSLLPFVPHLSVHLLSLLLYLDKLSAEGSFCSMFLQCLAQWYTSMKVQLLRSREKKKKNPNKIVEFGLFYIALGELGNGVWGNTNERSNSWFSSYPDFWSIKSYQILTLPVVKMLGILGSQELAFNDLGCLYL